MVDSFRVHMHDSEVQHVLSPPEHEALRVSLHADDDAPLSAGMILEGSADGVNWFHVSTILANDVNIVLDSPWLHLRARGYGAGETGDNGIAVVEFLDANPTQSVKIDNSEPLLVDGEFCCDGGSTAATIAYERDLLEQILVEVREHTVLLKEVIS